MEPIRLDERKNFSDRLKVALRDQHIPAKPSVFARGFNLRADGSSVTSHAARKWLVGEAIPTQERILILARWLNVNAAWLRFGDAENADFIDTKDLADSLTKDETELVRGMMGLSAPSQAVVRELVHALRRMEGTIMPHKARTRE